MSNTYEGWNHRLTNRSWIMFPGQLVRIKQDCFEQTSIFGIIIECTYPDFGCSGSDRWLVLIDGKLNSVESFKIWPVEEKNDEKI
jgi:hypothetical protein